MCQDASHVLRETDPQGGLLANKVCEPCPARSVLRANYLNSLRSETALSVVVPETREEDYYICQQCPHPAMVVSNNRCVCSLPTESSPTWTAVGVEGYEGGITCVLTEELSFANLNRFAEVDYAYVEIPFKDGSTVPFEESRTGRSEGFQSYTVRESLVFEHYFHQAAVNCRYYRSAADVPSCQALANLCVLQMYNNEAPACQLIDEIHVNRDTWTDVSWDWRLSTPWLRYDDPATTVETDISIQLSVSFDMMKKQGTFDTLRYVLARYSLNGTFLGWTNLTSEFEFCTPTSNTVPGWLKFGFGYAISYDCNLLNVLKDFPEPEFYDMYLVDFANENHLYPVPVRIRNIVDNGLFPNENEFLAQAADDAFTRRFFLYDQISSRETVSGEAQVVRYAKEIKLTVKVREDFPDKILPPLLEIVYNERLLSDMTSQGVDENGIAIPEATISKVKFTVEYTQDFESFWSSATAFFILALSSVILLLLLRLYNWNRRNTRMAGDAPVDFGFVVRAVTAVFSTFAGVMFWFMFVYTEYFFIFFKLQSNVHLLLPLNREEFNIENDYFPFQIVLKICFFGQTLRLAEIIWKQTSCDIFFVDWEKPRGKVASKRGDGTKSRFAPVSVWRTIFMANEWNEIQTCRKYNVTFTLLLLGALLIGADLQYLATQRPNYQDLSPGPLNQVLRFANTTFWFLVIVYAQRLWRWAIQDRFITEPPTHSFVDLCTIAKVSMFILDEDYHGYYLHCRSQHEFADGSMLEISRQLRQEEEGLTTDRGLPGFPGMQTFEIYVSGEWKRQYEYIYRSMISEQLQGAQADAGSFLLRVFRRKGAKPAAEKLVRASRKLNAFLRSFIDQTTSEFPMEHREQTFIHRFLHLPPDMMSSKATIFYPDAQYGFESVLFYGETWNLMLFNILSIAIFDFWWDNTVLSLFLAYLSDCALVVVRTLFGNVNLASKTLVDDRFLI